MIISVTDLKRAINMGVSEIAAMRTENAALRAEIEQLRARPCPHVVGTLTKHCALAGQDARDAARYRFLRAGILPNAKSILNDSPQGIDAAIDEAIKESQP